jgi:hypothetical protein
LAERAAEPFAVWGIPAIQEQAQSHEVTSQSCGDIGRTEVVIDFGASPREGFLFGDPLPWGGE